MVRMVAADTGNMQQKATLGLEARTHHMLLPSICTWQVISYMTSTEMQVMGR